MLAIRLQRTGRSGHAQYRVIVQDAHRQPTSGRVVAYVGSYDPHAKTVNLKKDKVEFYLEHGAQPSPRVAGLLKKEGVKLPDWVTLATPKKRTTRNPDKLAKEEAAPKEEAPAEATEETAPADEAVVEEVSTPEAETPKEEEAPAEEEKPQEKAEEAPAEEKSEEPAAEAEK